jgi:AcrR family transcriptional regulator
MLEKLNAVPEVSDAKQRVLDIAEDLWMTQGYNRITLRDIADALGIKQASLYYHFPDGKEQLYLEVVSRVFDRHRIGLQSAIQAAGPSLRAALRGVTHWFASQPSVNFLGMMYADLPALSPGVAKQVSERAFYAMNAPLAEAFAAAHARGEIRPVDPILMAGYFISLMDGITFSLTQQNRVPRAILAEEAVTLMLDGLRPRPDEPHI